eukprot:6795528-Karenia_brevis.AAC.1
MKCYGSGARHGSNDALGNHTELPSHPNLQLSLYLTWLTMSMSILQSTQCTAAETPHTNSPQLPTPTHG